MSAASECYLNFIMVGIYLAKNDFNSKNYVFFPNVTQFSLHRYIATLGYIYCYSLSCWSLPILPVMTVHIIQL
jgi:hypothetical protein